MVRKNTIPTGWRNVSPVGQPIPGTRFIAFKVPLKGAINQRLTPNQKFTPKDLIVAMKGLNVELGLIIDLTYTTRYYSSKDLPKTIEYKKLYTIGLEVPDDATILQFKKWVRKFLWENAENEKLIGVHCTNGISRTGYLICRYLIDVEGWDPETAIQAFGEARGHHMDGDIYLTDLRTQPMRSNLGMNVWDADVDIIPLPNEMDGHIGRFPSEEYPRPEKRLYEDDHHHHNDLPGQIQLREFGCINKGPGQQRKPYHDLQFQEDLQPQRQIREKHFSEPQFYDDYQEVHQEDLDFAIRDSEQWQRSFHDNQFCDNLLESAPPRDFVSMGCGQRQRHFPNSDMPIDMQCNRGREQTRRLFYDQQSNDEFQARMQLKGQPFLNTGRGQRMRPFHSYPPHDAMHPPVGDFECVSRGCGKRMRPLLDQHDSELQREMTLEDFDSRDSESRCRPFHDHQSYDDFSEQAQSKEFVHSGPEQRMRPFNDHSPHDELSCEGYLDRWQSLSPRDHFPDNPLFNQRHKEDYNRNYRDDCPEDYRRICLSDEINRGEKSRFAPYPSHPGHHLSSAHQKVCSVSADYGREPQNDISREMDRGKRLPFVTIDYNYGLPLDCASEEEDRAHYDLPSREHYIWN